MSSILIVPNSVSANAFGFTFWCWYIKLRDSNCHIGNFWIHTGYSAFCFISSLTMCFEHHFPFFMQFWLNLLVHGLLITISKTILVYPKLFEITLKQIAGSSVQLLREKLVWVSVGKILCLETCCFWCYEWGQSHLLDKHHTNLQRSGCKTSGLCNNLFYRWKTVLKVTTILNICFCKCYTLHYENYSHGLFCTLRTKFTC